MSRHICPVCKEKVGQEYKTYKNRRYHIDCYKRMVVELYEKEQEKRPDREKLEEYICNKYNIEKITALIDSQINKYIEEKGYKYLGILETLRYYFETLENEKTDKIQGIGIVPFYYEEAEEFFKFKIKLNKTNKNKKINIINKKVKINKKDYGLENKVVNIDEI